MDITYRDSVEGIDWTQVSNVFRSVKWEYRDPEKLRRAFNASSYVRFAFAEEQLVGFGRTLDDGEFYAMVVDLAILPAFQGRGIGRTILAELRDELDGFIFTSLISAPGKEGFYTSQGWYKQKSAFIWPRTETQKQNHT
ncbi:MAG: GNAT family N-acetyltransferase [Cyanobacteria bacterium J06634_6]